MNDHCPLTLTVILNSTDSTSVVTIQIWMLSYDYNNLKWTSAELIWDGRVATSDSNKVQSIFLLRFYSQDPNKTTQGADESALKKSPHLLLPEHISRHKTTAITTEAVKISQIKVTLASPRNKFSFDSHVRASRDIFSLLSNWFRLAIRCSPVKCFVW